MLDLKYSQWKLVEQALLNNKLLTKIGKNIIYSAFFKY